MSFFSISRIGLPTVLGISLMTIPTAFNDSKKPSRSFYDNEDDTNLSPILETAEAEVEKVSTSPSIPPKESKDNTELKSTFIDGYKINTSNFLETHFNSLRKSAITQLNIADAELNNVTSAFKNEVNNLYSNLYSVYDPKDDFFPGFIYTLTTTLTGSILVNRRSLPIRFVTPLLFATLGFKLCLPGTFDNTVEVIKNWEAKSHPELLEYQRNFKKFLIDTERSAESAAVNANQSLISTVHDIRKSLVK